MAFTGSLEGNQMTKRRTFLITAAGAALGLTIAGTTPAVAGHGGHDPGELETVVSGLDGPRGVDALGHGKTLVTETDGTFSLVVERRHGAPKVIELGQVESTFAPAISAGRHGTVWLLTGGPEPGTPPSDNAATLFKWRWGYDAPVPVADIAAYQATDPDPYDLEDFPEDSNPFGVVALRDGSVLVADAAGNDLLHVWGNGHIKTVAELKPRLVETPPGLPGEGTEVEAEAVATSVTVGKDGYWYVGELRGFPATPGTSQIWRIKPGTIGATCDPEHPWGACARYADGLTSIVDLGAGERGIYAVTLSKLSWLAIESETPVPGAEIGGLFLVSKRHHGHHVWRHGSHGHGTTITELVPDQLTLPGGVDVANDPYVVGPVFGPGALMTID
jgi:hypothetical protein